MDNLKEDDDENDNAYKKDSVESNIRDINSEERDVKLDSGNEPGQETMNENRYIQELKAAAGMK